MENPTTDASPEKIPEKSPEEPPETPVVEVAPPSSPPPPLKPASAPLLSRAKGFLKSHADKTLILFGFGDIVRAIRSPSRTKTQVLTSLRDKSIELLGFGDVLKAARQPTKKTKRVLTSLFNKAADTAGRRFFVGTIRLATIAALASMTGISVYMMMGAVALVSGVASATFTFVKEYIGESIGLRKPAPIMTMPRAISCGKAFAGAVAGGAVMGAAGAWIARVPFLHHLFGNLKSVFNHAGLPSSGAGPLSQVPLAPRP